MDNLHVIFLWLAYDAIQYCGANWCSGFQCDLCLSMQRNCHGGETVGRCFKTSDTWELNSGSEYGGEDEEKTPNRQN
eukprot:3907950-Amphidinium_carterae.1